MSQLNGTKITPLVAMKAAESQRARKQALDWTNVMKEHQMSALVFRTIVGRTDGGSFFVGYLDAELRELGYAIVSFTVPQLGQHESGVVIEDTIFLVRAMTPGEKPRVLLG